MELKPLTSVLTESTFKWMEKSCRMTKFFYSNRIDIEWLIILNYESEINCKGLYSILSYGATGTKDR